jgi:hypothetical protein
VRGEVDGVHPGQPAAALAHRGTDGGTDDGITHGGGSAWLRSGAADLDRMTALAG